MTLQHITRRAAFVLGLVSVLGLAACSTAQVADTTGDIVGATARGTVHVVSGAGRLAGRGVGAAYNALTDE